MSDTAINKIIQYGTNAQRVAFTPNPAAGSQVLYIWYETDNAPDTYVWNGAAWVQINSGGTGDVVGPGSATDNAVTRYDGTTGKLIQNSVVTLGDTGIFAFPDDIRQTFNPGANAAGINVGSHTADPATPSDGDMWYNSTSNEFKVRINGSTVVLGSGGITQLTGDVTAGPGSGSQAATIANDAVTNAKLANMATQTIKGRTTAGTGDPEDLTAAQATAILDVMVGDSGAGGTKGLVPAPAAGDAAAGKFLKADATWAVPPGSGSILPLHITSADEVEQYNSTNLQTFRWYGTRTSGAQYNRLTLTFDAATQRHALWKGEGIGGSLWSTEQHWVDELYVYAVDGTNSTGNIWARRFGTTTSTAHWDNAIFNLNSSFIFKFSNGALYTDTKDLGFARNAAGVLEINDGSAGTFRDILARLLRSNPVAFASLPGTPSQGSLAAITDNNTATLGGTATGGGTGKALVYYDGTNWIVVAQTGVGGGSGDVVGPGSATDNAIARFDGTTGKLIQNSAITVADTSGNMAGVGTVNTHTIPGGTDTFTLNAATQTLTNKRITPRVTSETSSATPTINTDNSDVHRITAQAVDITSFTTNLSGTPTHGQSLIIEITGTAARAITWGASFESSTITLPTTTVSTDMLTVGFKWNSATSKWRCLAKA